MDLLYLQVDPLILHCLQFNSFSISNIQHFAIIFIENLSLPERNYFSLCKFYMDQLNSLKEQLIPIQNTKIMELQYSS